MLLIIGLAALLIVISASPHRWLGSSPPHRLANSAWLLSSSSCQLSSSSACLGSAPHWLAWLLIGLLGSAWLPLIIGSFPPPCWLLSLPPSCTTPNHPDVPPHQCTMLLLFHTPAVHAPPPPPRRVVPPPTAPPTVPVVSPTHHPALPTTNPNHQPQLLEQQQQTKP